MSAEIRWSPWRRAGTTHTRRSRRRSRTRSRCPPRPLAPLLIPRSALPATHPHPPRAFHVAACFPPASFRDGQPAWAWASCWIGFGLGGLLGGWVTVQLPRGLAHSVARGWVAGRGSGFGVQGLGFGVLGLRLRTGMRRSGKGRDVSAGFHPFGLTNLVSTGSFPPQI